MNFETQFFTVGNYRVFIDGVFVGRFLKFENPDMKIDEYRFRQNPDLWLLSASQLQLIYDNLKDFYHGSTKG